MQHGPKSYERMGKALFQCISGCTCNNLTIDAHHTLHGSFSVVHWVAVTPAEKCTVQAEILKETSSGAHKFKVCMTLLARGPYMDGWLGVQCG